MYQAFVNVKYIVVTRSAFSLEMHVFKLSLLLSTPYWMDSSIFLGWLIYFYCHVCAWKHLTPARAHSHYYWPSVVRHHCPCLPLKWCYMNYTIEHQRVLCLFLFHLIISKFKEVKSNYDKLLLKTVDIAIIPEAYWHTVILKCQRIMNHMVSLVSH